jgi:hypothetical protein
MSLVRPPDSGVVVPPRVPEHAAVQPAPRSLPAASFAPPDRVAHAAVEGALDLRAAHGAFGRNASARVVGLGSDGSVLATTPTQAAAIRAGVHQVRSVDGVQLQYPSQRLAAIESTNPYEHGQTHVLTKHVGQSTADDIARLRREPHITGAGGFSDAASAQFAVDRTIANPASQRTIARFLAGPSPTIRLPRVALDRAVGTTVSRASLDAGRPAAEPATTANVVLIKDPSFPERYRVLTAYPASSQTPDVDAAGAPFSAARSTR